MVSPEDAGNVVRRHSADSLLFAVVRKPGSGERWVDITQRVPPLPGTTGPADLAADAREFAPLVTPIRVMLALLVLLLTLGAYELARRPSRRAD